MKKLDPDKSIGFLIYDVSRLLRRDFDQRVEHLGLTQVQWRALSYIATNDGIKQVTLADYLEVRPITLTRLIDRLQQAGWVERRPDRKDRRAMCLHVTQDARPLLDDMHKQAQATRKRALSGISREQRDELVQTLKSMKLNLSDGDMA